MEIEKEEFYAVLKELQEFPPKDSLTGAWEVVCDEKSGDTLFHNDTRAFIGVAGCAISDDKSEAYVLPWFRHPDPDQGWVVGSRMYVFGDGPAPSSVYVDVQPRPYSVTVRREELFDIDDRVLEVCNMFYHEGSIYIELMHGKTLYERGGRNWYKVPV